MKTKTNVTSGMKTKEYLPSVPATWWLRRKTYFFFMVRELTCVAVGGYALFLLFLVDSAHSQTSFHTFFVWLKESRLSLALHAVALPMVVYHTVTWFNLTPKVIVVWRGEEKVNPRLIVGTHFFIWILVSILVAWTVLG